MAAIRGRGGRRFQGGQAMVEYLYAFPILVMLIFGALQFAFIYQAKATLNNAVFLATRGGALANGQMASIQDALASGFAPLFNHDKSLAALKQAYTLADTELRDKRYTRIWIVNPTAAALNDFKGDSEKGNAIPNDNLMYRDTGVKSSMSVQDANLLKVRVAYCFRMVVPVINRIIYNLAVNPPGSAQPDGTSPTDMLATTEAARNGGTDWAECRNTPDNEFRLPIEAEAVVRMQTPFRDPGKWVGP